MSIKLDPVGSNTRTSLVNSSSSSSAATVSKASLVSSPSPELSTTCKLIAFPSNSASFSVNSNDDSQKNHNERREYLDNGLMVKHPTSLSTPLSSNTSSIKAPSTSASHSSSPSSSFEVTKGLRKSSLENRYSTINRLDREWCSARKRQLDEMLVKLQHLHKLNLDDRENIEGMKKKTIKLIATYSNITTKTNNFLIRWERKHGSKLKNIQSSITSPSPSTSPVTFTSSNSYDDKYEPAFLFNTSAIW